MFRAMLFFVSLSVCLHFAYSSGIEDSNPPEHSNQNVLPTLLQNEIMETFPGVTNETSLVDFLRNATYLRTLMSIHLQICYFNALETHRVGGQRNKRDLIGIGNWFVNLFPKDFWVKDVHKGYYHYLKHLDPWRWWDEAYGWIEIKSSLPPLYYVAKYCPEEIRFLKNMNYTEEFYPNLTWPPGLDPLWTGNPNMTTNLFTELTSSSSSESISWEPYSGESTTTGKPSNNWFWKKK